MQLYVLKICPYRLYATFAAHRISFLIKRVIFHLVQNENIFNKAVEGLILA